MQKDTTQAAECLSHLTAELGSKLWAVNIPPEPDSKMLYPVPTLEIGQELVIRLKKEALESFKMVGDIVSESIYFEEWAGTPQEHIDYLEKNNGWWDNCTFFGLMPNTSLTCDTPHVYKPMRMNHFYFNVLSSGWGGVTVKARVRSV